MSVRSRLAYLVSGGQPHVTVTLPERYRGSFLVSLHDGTPHDPDTEVRDVGRRVVSFKTPSSTSASLTSSEAFFVVPGDAAFDHWALWRRGADTIPMHTGRLPRREKFSVIGGDYTMVVTLAPPDGLAWPSEVAW